MIKKHIPNCITLANLLCGTLSIYFLYVSDNALLPSIFIVLGAIFDFCDGLTARLLKVTSAIGKELDSLSDVVTFGLAPSLIMVEVLKDSLLANDYSLFAANVLGCIIMVPVVMLSKKKDHKIPFGPFLILGFLLIFLAQANILEFLTF